MVDGGDETDVHGAPADWVSAYLRRRFDDWPAVPRPEARPQLEAVRQAAERRWPSLDVDHAAFAAALAAGAAEHDVHVPAVEGAAEVYLAVAMVGGDRAATRAFEREYVLPLRGQIAVRCGGPEHVDDVCQRLRTRLLSGETPAILRYAGRGRLAGLVKVAAMRLALNARRDERRRHERDDGLARHALADALDEGPELARIRKQHAGAFKAAFQHAAESLEPRQRTLLRLHLLDRLSIDEIGSIYDAHRSTAARWLARARSDVADRTKEQLRTILGDSTEDLDALLGLVRSRLDLSLSRVLGRDGPG